MMWSKGCESTSKTRHDTPMSTAGACHIVAKQKLQRCKHKVHTYALSWLRVHRPARNVGPCRAPAVSPSMPHEPANTLPQCCLQHHTQSSILGATAVRRTSPPALHCLLAKRHMPAAGGVHRCATNRLLEKKKQHLTENGRALQSFKCPPSHPCSKRHLECTVSPLVPSPCPCSRAVAEARPSPLPPLPISPTSHETHMRPSPLQLISCPPPPLPAFSLT